MTTNGYYSQKDAFDLYVYYLAMKKHFTSSFDFVKYNGKVNATLKSFEKRNDKFSFYKLSKKKHAKELILANFLVDNNVWIGYLNEPQAEQVYYEWRKVIDSLSYTFDSDLSRMDEDFNRNIIVPKNGEAPLLLQLYMAEDVCLETLVILDDLTNCFSYWEKNYVDTIVFPHINKLVSDYRPFLQYDKEKMKRAVVNKFKHTST